MEVHFTARTVANETIAKALQERVLILDGGWGASIQKLSPTEEDYRGHSGCLDYLVITRPDIVEAVHLSYLEAGCDIIETNTFGASGTGLAEYGLQPLTRELNRKAAQLARSQADRASTPEKPRWVAGSIGPGTRLPSLGHIDFDSLEQGYFEQALGLILGGADYLQVETVQDLLQGKAALHAANRAGRESGRTLPIALLVTLEKGKTLLGTDLQTAVSTFAPYDLLAFGINCSTGPVEMEEPLRQLAQTSPFPLIVMPNAGLPRWKQGGYGYDLTPAEFAVHLARFIRSYGIRLAGGCCGTTSEHLQALSREAKTDTPWRPLAGMPACATSMYAVQELRVDPRPLIIGERTNATGSNKFREALTTEDADAQAELAIEQQEEGAHLLDLSLAYAGRREVEDYGRLVPRLNRELHIPLCIDTTDPAALEVALKNTAGRAVINSINLEDGGLKASRVLELAAEFGASVIGLCIDEKGMAQSVERKLEVAGRILELAASRGLSPSRLLLDALTFSLATGDATLAGSARETLAAVSKLKQAHPESLTVLGVSNVSYGFSPYARQVLNTLFLYHALQNGLDAAILHAGKILPLDQVPERERQAAENLLFERGQDPLATFLGLFSGKEERRPAPTSDREASVEERLREEIVGGRKKAILETVAEALRARPALEILDQLLLPAMKEVGERFAAGTMQLPFVLKAAETMRAAVEHLGPHLQGQSPAEKGSMVLATVRGDIHDIGKNLVDIIMSHNGYRVHNIGKDKSREEIIAAIRQYAPHCLGLSGLLVKSTLEMKELLIALGREGLALPVICGGAALRRDFVKTVLQPEYRGPVHYAADAFEAMAIMEGGESQPQEERQTPEAAPAITAAPRKKLRRSKPPKPPFWGREERPRQVPWEEALATLDRKTLFHARWKIDHRDQGEAWLEQILRDLPPELRAPLPAVIGHFPCRRSGDDLVVDGAPSGVQSKFTFSFPALPSSANPPLAHFFSDANDVVTFFLVTIGPRFTRQEEELYQKNEYQRYLLLHGFAAQMAEAGAACLNEAIRREMGVKKPRGRRFSPGYPAWPALEDQRKLFALLRPEEIGVSLSATDQLIPEHSVSAMVLYHPQAANP